MSWWHFISQSSFYQVYMWWHVRPCLVEWRFPLVGQNTLMIKHGGYWRSNVQRSICLFTVIIDRDAREIMYSVASVRLSVRLSVLRLTAEPFAECSCCGQLWVWHMFCGQDLWWAIPLHIFHWSCWGTIWIPTDHMDLCQTHCKQVPDFSRAQGHVVYMGCALAVVFQVHSPYVPL